MKHLGILVVFALLVGVLGLWLRHRDTALHFGGRAYVTPSGCTKPDARDLPLHDVGNDVFVPSHVPEGTAPAYLYVRRAGCLHTYDLSGGP